MSALKDLTGQKFGRLTVIERAENINGRVYWKCHCDCGNESVVESYPLRKGFTQSCGCFSKDFPPRATHGMAGTKIYRTWCKIKGRCLDFNNNRYKYYGGRGISIYPEWIDNFQAFYDYVSKLPHFGEENYTLDRIDNNGNYEPNNLRWADRTTQASNKRNNILVEFQGKKMTLTDAAEKSGINCGTLFSRYYEGDRGERLFRPVRRSTCRKSS